MKKRSLKREVIVRFLASVLMLTFQFRFSVTDRPVPSKYTAAVSMTMQKMYSLEGKESGEYIAGLITKKQAKKKTSER